MVCISVVMKAVWSGGIEMSLPGAPKTLSGTRIFYCGGSGPIRSANLSEARTRIDIGGEAADNGTLPMTIRSLIVTINAQPGACLSRACDAFERRPSAAFQENSPTVVVWGSALGTKSMHRASDDLVEAVHAGAPLWGALRQPINVALDFRLAASAGA